MKNMISRRNFLAAAGVVAAAGVLTACGGSSSTAASAAGSTAAAASGDTIKVGVMGPLSGNVSVYGQAVVNGATLYLKQVNANGGINGKQIELKGDEDALDTFNLARMDADNERQNRYADEDELADAGFDYVADEEVDASYDDEGDEF